VSPQENRIKLSDFGVAQKVEPDLFMTQMYGTPFYSAPEVINGCYTSKSDLWSVGVILHVLLCGSLPFMHNDIKKLLPMIATSKQI
jgi:calcium-dependent protein kinase